MSERGGDEFEPLVVEVTDTAAANADDDAIVPVRNRPNWWRIPRNLYLVAAALIMIAVIVAYQLDGRSNPTGAAPTSSGASAGPVIDGRPLVAATGALCGVQTGPQRLQLGLEIVNQSARPVTLVNLTSSFPLGGLREVAQAQGPCGQLESTTPIAGVELAAGARTWVAVTYDVLVDCPTPNPVNFTLAVAQSSSATSVKLGGFADLGGVTYSGCPDS